MSHEAFAPPLPWMRHLRWKLTVSYALVTVAAVLMINLLVVGGLLLTQYPQTPPVLAESLLDVAPQLAAYLRPPPDRVGLAQWLSNEDVFINGTSGSETMAVVDASGTVLATFRWGDLPQGVSLGDQIPPQAQPVLASALQGNVLPEQIATWGPNSEMIAVVPLKDTQGSMLGVWYVEQNRAPFLTLGETALFLGVALVSLSGVVFLFALIIGTAFGFLVARGLTQRLQRLVVAADGWSQGNVLHLIADGLSNADIAARLVISEKTVKSHVSNILSKLQLADRTQAAVWAWRMGVMGRDRHT